MNTLYLICFVLGLVFSFLAVLGGAGHLHLGHFHLGSFHFGHGHVGPVPAGHLPGAAHAAAQAGAGSAFNGFTIAAFLCWFGGVGYLLRNFTGLLMPLVLLLAAASGLAGAGLLYGLLFKVLLPRERVLTPEDTRMDGVLARVSNEIRAGDGVGEVLFSQTGVRRHAAARSEGGTRIARGTEVVVLRYEHGVAWVSPLQELAGFSGMSDPPDPGDGTDLSLPG